MTKVKIYIFYLFIINLILIELCCPFCHFKGLHEGHKLLSIVDEESLKKENITLEYSTNIFNKFNQKLSNLKEKLENELNEIDILYYKINDEITKSFEMKHNKLLLEENELKEKLQNKITKTKEQLEKYLSLSNILSKKNEKINKGIKSFINEGQNNMIRNLSYISTMNKNKKEINSLF